MRREHREVAKHAAAAEMGKRHPRRTLYGVPVLIGFLGVAGLALFAWVGAEVISRLDGFPLAPVLIVLGGLVAVGLLVAWTRRSRVPKPRRFW